MCDIMHRHKFVLSLLLAFVYIISTQNGSSALYAPKPRQPPDRMLIRRKLFTDEGTDEALKLFIHDRDLNRSVTFGSDTLNRLDRLEINLGWSKIHVKPASPSHGQLIQGTPALEALRHGKEAHIAARATSHLLSFHCRKHNLQLQECAKHVTAYKLSATQLHPSCSMVENKCSKSELFTKYRSIDGSCNHIEDGTVGKSYTGYKRLLFPNYIDGVQTPRGVSVTKEVLPSARLVSTEMVKNFDNVDPELTLALMQWSEFVEHDLAHTATSKMVHSGHSIECCQDDGGNLSPRYIHPFCSRISVPDTDSFYSQFNVDCLPYVRSVPALRADCSFGPIDQLNQASHFLDGSPIYGSDNEVAQSLRLYTGGLLKVTESEDGDLLPIVDQPEEYCQVVSTSSLCFKSGDVRVNSYPHLTTMHTLWHREHNRIAKELSLVNPQWDDETLYQEARRVVIAEIQHITYNEWLPLILGKRYVNKIQPKLAYKDDVDPSVSNSFATAALRFINSLMESKIRLYQENRNVNMSLNLMEHFNKPTTIQVPGHFDALVRGLATQSSQKMDLDYISDLTSQLYRHNSYGFDIISFDIQRGRDHGLPSYSAYRGLCGLAEVNDFEEFLDVMSLEALESLRKVYRSPHDVDLFIGGMLEKPVGNSLLGPTFSCLIAEQLLRTKVGDRYFYTSNEQPVPFKKDQMKNIKEITLARIFCDNGNSIKSMQPNVFNTISTRNNLVDCKDTSEIPRLHLHLWKYNKSVL